MDNKTILQVDSVSKRFGTKQVLDEVTFTIAQPEIFGLLGPSGAGKTTLVKMMAGMDEPSDGHILMFGQKMPNLQLMKRIGYMGQSDALYEELTAIENLTFFAKLYGMSRNHLKKRSQEVLDLVGLTPDAKKTIQKFSGGMKRRLSLATALIHEPDILILDEPTVGIDPVLRKRLWDTFEDLQKNGVTIIVTSHVMDEAERCQRLGMIRDGHLIALGSPNDLKMQTGSSTMEQAFLSYGGIQNAH